MFEGLKHQNRSTFLNGGDVLGSFVFTDGAGAFAVAADSDKLPNGLPSLLRGGTGIYTLTVPKARRLVVLSAYVVAPGATEADRRDVKISVELASAGTVQLRTCLVTDGTEADPIDTATLKVLVRIEGLY